MKKLALATLLALTIIAVAFVNAPLVDAQTATPVPTTAGPSNSVEGYLIVCSDSAILNFSGTMLVGYDIYYQIFSGAAGSGTAISNVRQVPAAGDFAVSDRVTYNSGVTVAAGGTASANVSVARESDSSRVDFSFVLTDSQDGCNNPSNPLVESADLGGGSTSTDTTSSGAGITTSIRAPGGGALNPNLSPEPDVVIGARLSDNFRSDTPGLIFAECDAYPLAEPGILYDTDNITIFWSWYAKTPEDMQQHLDNALYHVTLNTAELPMTTRTEPTKYGSNYWVFYTAQVGNLRPGHYEVGYLLTWQNPITDGYNDFGPGTADSRESGICNFDIKLNPDAKNIDHSDMYFPTIYPVHDITPDH